METVTIKAQKEVVRVAEAGETVVVRVTDRAFSPGGESYTGPYVVTPSDEAQELLTAFKKMGGNVVVEPIPENWGLISFNGMRIRVS